MIALSSYRERAAMWRRGRIVFGLARDEAPRRARWMGSACAAELPRFENEPLARAWRELCAGRRTAGASRAGELANSLGSKSEAIWLALLGAESDAPGAMSWDRLSARAESDPVARRHVALARALWHADRDELGAALEQARVSFYLGRRAAYHPRASVDAFVERLGSGLVIRAFLAACQEGRPADALAILDEYEAFSSALPAWLERHVARAARDAGEPARARLLYEELFAERAIDARAGRELVGELASTYFEEGDAVRGPRAGALGARALRPGGGPR